MRNFINMLGNKRGFIPSLKLHDVELPLWQVNPSLNIYPEPTLIRSLRENLAPSQGRSETERRHNDWGTNSRLERANKKVPLLSLFSSVEQKYLLIRGLISLVSPTEARRWAKSGREQPLREYSRTVNQWGRHVTRISKKRSTFPMDLQHIPDTWTNMNKFTLSP